MKTSQTVIESLSDMEQVATAGDLRRIVGNTLLALVRKEISHTDVEALAKGIDSIANLLQAEVKVAKACIELREKGANLGRVAHLGSMMIGNAPKKARDDDETEPEKK